MTIDSLALLPVYVVAAAAVLVLVLDLARPGLRTLLLVVAGAGAVAAAASALVVGVRPATFCVDGGCSYALDRFAIAGVVAFCALTVGVLALSVPAVRSGTVPAGEYAFLLLCSLVGGVALAAARDLLTLVVALESLTLPVYLLVGLRRSELRSIEAATTFFVVSVVSTAVTLLGAALLYVVTGAVHLDRIAAAGLGSTPLARAGVVLVIGGLAFKVAAVPFHAWAPATYDGAPLPIAAYLSTVSKLGGVVALLLVTVRATGFEVAGPALAVVAAVTMTVGNLVALRQRRMVRLLAWSSVAQAGYILAPLAGHDRRAAIVGTVAYAAFYALINLGAFAALVAWRGAGDGGEIGEYRGLARRSPWTAAAFVLALAGLAGLPPGLAGLFAKVTVVRSLLDGSTGWLAVVVGLNAVIGLAYYTRVASVLFSNSHAQTSGGARAGRAVALVAAAAAVAIGFAPQLVLDAAGVIADALGTGISG